MRSVSTLNMLLNIQNCFWIFLYFECDWILNILNCTVARIIDRIIDIGLNHNRLILRCSKILAHFNIAVINVCILILNELLVLCMLSLFSLLQWNILFLNGLLAWLICIFIIDIQSVYIFILSKLIIFHF
jgi:hypothetical protein